MQNIEHTPIIRTDRLILRPWREEDLGLFAKINADPKVMEYFPSILSKEESDSLAEKIQKELTEKKYGLWAVEVSGVAPFIGFIGLHYQDFHAAFTPCVEVGWRLDIQYWGKGYATEGAKAALNYGFKTIGLNEVVSFTAVQNMRSIAVMERIGMSHQESDDFDHPKLPEGRSLRRHVLYRITADEWRKMHGDS